jgi:membrane-associated phospholipid phosphatase
MVIHALFRVPGFRRVGGEDYPFDKLSLAITAAVVALLATALLHLLMVSTPRAGTFFAWIMGIFVVAVIVQELLSGGNWLSNVLFSALYLVIGVAIASLLAGVARTAVKYVATEPDPRPLEENPRGVTRPAPDPNEQTRRLPPV